jgi:hypothetical protein
MDWKLEVCLLFKCKALSSNPSPSKKKKKRERERKHMQIQNHTPTSGSLIRVVWPLPHNLQTQPVFFPHCQSVLPVLEFHTNRIIWYVVFFLQLLSLSILLLDFIHISKCSKIQDFCC